MTFLRGKNVIVTTDTGNLLGVVQVYNNMTGKYMVYIQHKGFRRMYNFSPECVRAFRLPIREVNELVDV